MGDLEAREGGDVEGASLGFALPARWRGADGVQTVLVTADCVADGPRLGCVLNVDGQTWDASFDREPPLD